MRIAAIDIGTNSVHMIVVQVRPDRSFEVVDREKEMVRLGSGGLGGRALTETATTAALQALAKFRRLAESHDVDEIVAAATSAVREADNGREFLNAIRQRTGIRVRVISGTEEARLIHRAAVYGVDVTAGPAVVVDIGGGSVELTRGSAAQLQVVHSAKIGVIRLTEQFVRTDPITDRDIRRMTKHIGTEVAEAVERIVDLGYERVIGTSGTILSLGALAVADQVTGSSDDLRNRRISTKQIRRLRRELTGLTLEERLQLPGLDPGGQQGRGEGLGGGADGEGRLRRRGLAPLHIRHAEALGQDHLSLHHDPDGHSRNGLGGPFVLQGGGEVGHPFLQGGRVGQGRGLVAGQEQGEHAHP